MLQRIRTFFEDDRDIRPVAPIGFDHPSLAAFKNAHQELCAIRNHLPPVKNITAVGAQYNIARFTGLSDRDQAWLALTLELCARTTIPLTPHTTLTPINLACGQDFLAPSTPPPATDILIIGFIINAQSVAGQQIMRRAPTDIDHLVSPHQHPDVWRNAADHSKAKLIVVFRQNEIEVGQESFAGSDFRYVGQKQVMAPSYAKIIHDRKKPPILFKYRMEILVRRRGCYDRADLWENPKDLTL